MHTLADTHRTHIHITTSIHVDAYKADTHSNKYTGTKRSTFAEKLRDVNSQQTHAHTAALYGVYTLADACKISNRPDMSTDRHRSTLTHIHGYTSLSPKAPLPHLLQRPKKS